MPQVSEVGMKLDRSKSWWLAKIQLLEPAEPEMDVRDMLRQCKTLTPSLMTGEQAIERLKEINVHVYRCLNDLGVRFPAENQ
uniref:hypothetical protein n=1 Tax=Nitrospira cf. moscoviensis SBR1015 TaxID=96242 RepID=UPI00111EA6BE|nr:hypothetical protein [Nitrospira cf. moscoviensis SBR1015]